MHYHLNTLDKKTAQARHLRARGMQRLGIRIGKAKHEAIVKHIRHNKATYLSKQSTRVHRYRVQLWGEDMKVVYDRKRQQVITVWRYQDVRE